MNSSRKDFIICGGWYIVISETARIPGRPESLTTRFPNTPPTIHDAVSLGFRHEVLGQDQDSKGLSGIEGDIGPR